MIFENNENSSQSNTVHQTLGFPSTYSQPGQKLSPKIEAQLRALENIAWTMENLIPLPATSVRIGLDTILGVVPVVGDIFALVPAAYVIRCAARMGASRRLLIRMVLNVGVDLIAGAVPIIGDVFDATWNASTRNTQLLRIWLETGSIPKQLPRQKPLGAPKPETAI